VAKEKAKQDAIEAKERAKKEAMEAEEARKAEQEARKEADRVAKEKARQEAEEAIEIQITKSEKGTVKAQEIDKGAVKIGHEMFKGMVKLLIAPPMDSKHMKELEGNLQQTKGLRLILVGGTAGGGMQIVISVKKPTPLLRILFNMASVEEASGKGDEIRVSLK